MTTSNKAPVLLFTYRKTQFLDEIFQAIKRYSPPRLYVMSNQYANEEESVAIKAVREIIKSWDFSCETVHLFHKNHLLINDSIHYGLDHVLSTENAAIVLEDDTVPSNSFFDFCNNMLNRYCDDDQVGSIIGCNLGADTADGHNYKVPLALFYWGWATWAKKWKSLRGTPLPWGKEANHIAGKLQDPANILIPFLEKLDDRCTWDVRWGWQQALNNMEAVISGKNLISNKGFVKEGSYIRFMHSRFSSLKVSNSKVELSETKRDIGACQKYESESAELLSEILAARGELAFYTK